MSDLIEEAAKAKEALAKAIWAASNAELALIQKTIEWASANQRAYLAIAGITIKEIEKAGYAVVPKEPTPEMVKVGTEARWRSPIRNEDNVREIYRAMLAAKEGPK